MSIGVTGDKPKKPYQQLGPDVKITSLDEDSDLHADMLLRDAGKSMTPAGSKYLGSIASHIYITDSDLATTNKEAHIKNQFCIKDVGIGLVSTAIADQNMQFMRRYMGRTLKTTDTKDTRK